jgi:N-acetylneuraminic acid mutarotase
MKSIRYILIFIAVIPVIVSSAEAQTGSWKQVKGFPGVARDALESFTIGNTIYLGGGEGQKDFYAYDPSAGTWAKRADLPGVGQARAFGVSFAIGKNGYVALGQDSDNQADVLGDLWEYDTSANTWSPKAGFPFPRCDGAFAFVIGGLAYVGGGVDSIGEGWNEFYSYDPAANAWTTLSPLPFGATFFPASFVLGNYGYLVTGTDSDLVWQYDPSSDTWNQLSNFPGPNRETAVSFVLNNVAYIGLGEDTFTNVFKDMYCYDPATDTWTAIPSLNFHTSRGWAMAATVGDTAYVGFGFDFNTFYNDIWKFSPASASVEEAAVTNAPIAFPNPVHDFLNLSQIPDGNGVTVSILNEIGSEVKSFYSITPLLDMADLPSGIYNLEITSGEYHAVQRIVKE